MEALLSVFNLGLIILIIGWLMQLIHSMKGKKDINRWFLAIYSLGILAIVMDGLMQGLVLSPALNLLVLLIVLAVMIKTMGKQAKK